MRFALALAALFAVTSCAGEEPPENSDTECCTVTIRTLVPEGTGTIYLAGNLPELGPWQPDGLAMTGEGRERLLIDGDVEASHEIAEFKKDPLEYFADWEGSGVLGRLVYWADVESEFLGRTRHVEIWLPPGYDDDPSVRYPVLYMHDGQNLFDPRIANTGVDWGVDEAVVRLSDRGVIPPVIVVGAWSTAERGPEYSPWHGAPGYARFLLEELMPKIDAEFRTLTGPDNTAVAGSSMGGLLSFYLVTHHPDAFGACACLRGGVGAGPRGRRRGEPRRDSLRHARHRGGTDRPGGRAILVRLRH
jgi:hypothetical protein